MLIIVVISMIGMLCPSFVSLFLINLLSIFLTILLSSLLASVLGILRVHLHVQPPDHNHLAPCLVVAATIACSVSFFSSCFHAVNECVLPTLVIHGTADRIVPPAPGRRSHAASGAPRKPLTLIEGAGHNDIAMSEEYFKAIAAFVDEAIGDHAERKR